MEEALVKSHLVEGHHQKKGAFMEQSSMTNTQTEHIDLDEKVQEILLLFARKSLVYAVETGKVCPVPKEGIIQEGQGGEDKTQEALPPIFYEKRAAFVSLYKEGRLRGCIGELLPTRPLAQCVAQRAYDAALNDHRFSPVRPEELESIQVEVSVLSPPVSVGSFEDIEIGKHGIIVQKGRASAVFLPQVAPEQGWDLPTTLSYLSQKAGLNPLAWQDKDMQFFVFTAQVVGEK